MIISPSFLWWPNRIYCLVCFSHIFKPFLRPFRVFPGPIWLMNPSFSMSNQGKVKSIKNVNGARWMKKETILVLEDESGINELICQNLKDEGHYTISSLTGENAAMALSQIEIDLIITDINLPGMSGFDLLDFARKRGIEVPKIIISGKLDESYVDHLVNLDNYLLLPKPFDMITLLGKAEEAKERNEAA
jgi:CheY-like chemotaxis protein